MQTTTIDLIRHGEPEGGRRYRGNRIDDPLSEKGWRQMRAAVGDAAPWNAIVSSPLRRCAEFARELAQRHALPLNVDPRWREIGFGAWEGKTSAQLEAEDPDILLRFWTDPEANRPAGAEPLAAFRDRIAAAWDALVADHTGQHLLLVGHAGQMRMTLGHVLGLPVGHMFRWHIANAGISRIRIQRRGPYVLPRLLFVNARQLDG